MFGLVMKVSRRWLIIAVAVSGSIVALAAPVSVAAASPSAIRTTSSHAEQFYLAALEEPRPSNQVVNVPEDPTLEGANGSNPTPSSGGSGSSGGTWILYVGGGVVVLMGIAYFAQGQKK